MRFVPASQKKAGSSTDLQRPEAARARETATAPASMPAEGVSPQVKHLDSLSTVCLQPVLKTPKYWNIVPPSWSALAINNVLS